MISTLHERSVNARGAGARCAGRFTEDMKTLVLKFGGTSVGSAKAIKQAADIVRDLVRQGHRVCVVTSAMSGVTDALLGSAIAATSGHAGKVRELTASVRAKHEQALEELQLPDDEHAAVWKPVAEFHET